jgi:hypothetical protein
VEAVSGKTKRLRRYPHSQRGYMRALRANLSGVRVLGFIREEGEGEGECEGECTT